MRRKLVGKKERERLLLGELRSWCRNLPEGEILEGELPDFVIEGIYGERIGIEITECFRGPRRKGGSSLRERDALQDKLVRLAEDAYYGRYKTLIYAHFTWPLSQEERLSTFSRPLPDLAAAAARVIGESVSGRVRGCLELGPAELGGTSLAGIVEELSAHRTGFVGADGRGSPWGSTRSYVRRSASVDELERAIGAKDGRATACLDRCDEAWLVVALVGGPSSFDGVDDAVLAHHFRSRYDRVLLLCPGGDPDRRVLTLVGP